MRFCRSPRPSISVTTVSPPVRYTGGFRYFKATEEDWPSTGAYAEHAVYENNLEDELKKHWPDFGTRMTKLIEDRHGFPGKHKGPTGALPPRPCGRPRRCSNRSSSRPAPG